MEYESVGFVEAIESLAEHSGMAIPWEGPKQSTSESRVTSAVDSDLLYQINLAAHRYYQQQLRQHPDASMAIDYLKNRRQISGETCRTFGIGFAPSGWNNLLTHLASYSSSLLVEAGLVIHQAEKQRYYDRFRERIIFPLRDLRGRVIAFGGRVMGDEKPKYLNSPESPIFHKGDELYGLYEIRQQRQPVKQIIVVEGYMDVIALHQGGITNSVATLGTAVTASHLRRLFRNCSDIIFCFDGDSAGLKAAWRGLENGLELMQGDRQIRFLFLPQGEDPDSVICSKGAEYFLELSGAAKPLSQFMMDKLAEDLDLAGVEGKARLQERIIPLLARVPQGEYRDLLGETLIRTFHLQREKIVPQNRSIEPRKKTMCAPTQRQPMTLIRKCIALILQHPSLANLAEHPQRYRSLRLQGALFFAELLEFIQQNPNLTTASLLEMWRDREEGKHLEALALKENLILDTEIERLEEEFRGALKEMDRALMKQEYDDLLLKHQHQGLGEEERERYMELSRVMSGKY